MVGQPTGNRYKAKGAASIADKIPQMTSLSNTKDEATQTTESLISSAQSSPRKPKATGGEYNQTDLREPIAQEMASEILECPIDAFLTHYATFIPSKESIENALQAFKDDQNLDRLLEEVEDGDERFWTWADFGPSTVKPDADEVVVFRPLQQIVDFLEGVECRERDAMDEPRNEPRNCDFSYKDCPSATIKAEIPGTNFRVDACITSRSSQNSKDVILSDTAVIAEFKKNTKAADVWDNRLKLVSAASHILNDDPCRTWVYGITIEGTQMSVWYFCRSHSVKSESFDFTKDIKKFIQVFLSFLYASRKEIGYDPTVHRILQDDEICYVYDVGTEEQPRFFRTKRLIFTSRVLCTTGRKTRVWEAVEVEGREGDELVQEKGKPVALKDGWLDEDSRTEGDIQLAIFTRLEGIRDTDYEWAPASLRGILDNVFQRRNFTDYFMEILWSRKIAKTKVRLPQAKLPKRPVLSSPPLVPADSKQTKNRVQNSTQNKGHSGLPSNPRPVVSRKVKRDSPPREYRVKQQHRLIYRDVGSPLHHAKDIKTSFLAIKDTLIALVLMYLAGWTHRDVSTGNIILVKRGDGSQGGKLSDLEYAREFVNHRRSPDPKTGTPFFMPLEIHMSDRLYRAPFSKPRVTGETFEPEEEEEDVGPPKRVTPKFRFQHDLESLWWIALWIVLYRVKHPVALELADDVFTEDECPTQDRIDLFTNNAFARQLKPVTPSELSAVVQNLNKIRLMLYFSYVDDSFSGDGVMFDSATYSEIYVIVWVAVDKAVTEAQAISFNFDDLGIGNTNKTVSQKRARSKPKPRGDDEYEPVTDDEEDSDQMESDADEPEAKKHKPVAKLRRRQMGL